MFAIRGKRKRERRRVVRVTVNRGARHSVSERGLPRFRNAWHRRAGCRPGRTLATSKSRAFLERRLYPRHSGTSLIATPTRSGEEARAGARYQQRDGIVVRGYGGDDVRRVVPDPARATQDYKAGAALPSPSRPRE